MGYPGTSYGCDMRALIHTPEEECDRWHPEALRAEAVRLLRGLSIKALWRCPCSSLMWLLDFE